MAKRKQTAPVAVADEAQRRRSSRAVAAFDTQMELGRWWATEKGTVYAATYIGTGDRGSAMITDQRPEVMAGRETRDLLRAPTYWATPDMVELAEAAALSMEPQPLRETDLPTEAGFVVLGRPFYVLGQRDETLNVVAVRWQSQTVALAHRDHETGEQVTESVRGLHVVLYSDPYDPKDTGLEPLRERRAGDPPYLMLGSFVWLFGTSYAQTWDHEAADIVASDGGHTGMMRFLASFWALCQQKLPRFEKAQSTRKDRRRWERQGTPEPPDGWDVQVITLRRRKESHHRGEGDGDPVEWSHRWVVDGHWRWTPYTSDVAEDARCHHCGAVGVEHRQRWIAAFVKGPEDKPLIAKNKVLALKR